MLFLIATPIGNLEDITLRAIKTLQECDEILCEDTRHSRTLLNHYQIDKPLSSYHKFNEARQIAPLLKKLSTGRTIALISDAGTPGISDPGERLIRAAIDHGIEVVSIPGPCAAICALTSSGLSTTTFQFFGFLPKKVEELKRVLARTLLYSGTTICYESPRRIVEVLTLLHTLKKEVQVVVGRELTKMFEEIKRGTAEELAQYYKEKPPKGEIVLLIEGGHTPELDLPPEEKVAWIEYTFNLNRKDALKLVAEIWGLSKREIYKKLI